MSSRLPRMVLATVVGASMVTAASPARAAREVPATSRTQFTAEAYGTLAMVGKVVKSGKSAVSSLGACGVLAPGTHASNTVASVVSPPYVTTGVIDSTADSLEVGGTLQAQATADVHDLTILNGLITGTEVKSVSTTTLDGSSFTLSSDGSTFVDLLVAGLTINGNVDPNTRIDLLGFGYVVLNEQVQKVGSNNASLVVNMIHVFVTLPNPLVDVGTQIIVAHASTGLHSAIGGTLDGAAYGSSVNLDNLILSGPTAKVALACLGTNGQIRTNTVATVVFPPELSLGTVVDTAMGIVDGDSASGETTSTVQSVDVALGLVTAQLVTADAHSFTDGTSFTFSDDGSMFLGLSVSGFPEIGDDVGANTRLDVLGLGTLWLRRVIERPNSIEIRMIELIVTEENDLGIPVGADIRVAVARVSAH